MSGGNRLNREELRDEVKDYLVALREERIQRSIEVSERLRQLRVARVERLRSVRNSMVVTQSVREKTEEPFSRESLKTRVKEMRAEVQEMLKQYRATRNTGSGIDTQFTGPPSKQGSVDQVGAAPADNRKVARAVPKNEPKTEPVNVPAQPAYQDRLTQVVTDLGKKDRAMDQQKAVADTPQKGQSLMGRIRRLASGNYRNKTSKGKDTPVNGSSHKNKPVS